MMDWNMKNPKTKTSPTKDIRMNAVAQAKTAGLTPMIFRMAGENA